MRDPGIEVGLLRQLLKKLAVVERCFSGHCREVVVVERFKQEVMYGLSPGRKKSSRCREVAVMERWPLVEVRL